MLAPPELYVIVAVFPSILTNCSETASNAIIPAVTIPTNSALPAALIVPPTPAAPN